MALNKLIKEAGDSHLIGMLTNEEFSLILNTAWKAKERAEKNFIQSRQ